MSQPKYIKIKNSILAEIRGGKLIPGDQLPFRDELVKRFGTTRATVNKALKELIQEGVLRAKRRKGTFVAEGKPSLKSAFVSTLDISKVEDSRKHADIAKTINSLLLHKNELSFDFLNASSIVKNINILERYDLAIWAQPSGGRLPELAALDCSIMVINRHHPDLNFISTPHRQAVRRMTLNMLDRAGVNNRLFLLDLGKEEFVSKERRSGFLDACEERGKFYRILTLTTDYQQNVERLLSLDIDDRVPLIIISPSRFFTGAVLEFSRVRRLKIGERFFYSDFDHDNALETTGYRIPSIIQNYARMGEEVVKSVCQLQDRPGVLIQKFIEPTFTYLRKDLGKMGSETEF